MGLVLQAATVDLETRQVRRADGGHAELTPLEESVLRYLAAHPQRDISHDELLREVWGYAEGILTRAAYFTVRRLRTKIEADPQRPVHILTSHGVGYRYVPPDAPEPTPAQPPSPPVTASLSADPTPFFGRHEALRSLGDPVPPGVVVTLVGPAGTGKTRLMREFGVARQERAWFCDLSSTQHAAGLVRVVAAALRVELGSEEDAVSHLGQVLSDIGPGLLLLDNFEQLVATSATTVGTWARQAPAIRVVVTSRERLRLSNERVVSIGPLEEDDAVAMLVERARAVGSRVEATSHDDTLRRICRRLEGLPLAIELAAARMGVLAPDALLARLEDRFSVLTGGPRGGPERHRTLRAAIDDSWEPLPRAEQSALAQCSVFRGGFFLAQAEEVVDLSAHGAWVLDAIEALADKSLLRGAPEPSADGELRFSMVPSIQEYATERLNAQSGEAAAQVRHAEAYARLGAELAAAAARHEGSARRRLGLELENFDAVIDAQVSDETVVRAALAVDPVLATGAPRASRDRVLDRAMAVRSGVDDALQAELLNVRGQARRGSGDTAGAMVELTASLELARALDRPDLQAEALLSMGQAHLGEGHTQQARPWLDQAWEVAQQVDDPLLAERLHQAFLHVHLDGGDYAGAGRWADSLVALRKAADLEHLTFGNLGVYWSRVGDRERERAALRHDLVLHGHRGDRRHEANALLNLGVGLNDDGDAEALVLLEEAAATGRELGHRALEGLALFNLANAYVESGDMARAHTALSRCLSLSQAVGHTRQVSFAHYGLGWHALMSGGDARVHARSCVVAAQRAGDRMLTAFGRLLEAVALARAGDLGAAEALQDGRDWVQATGAARYRPSLTLYEAMVGLSLDPPDVDLALAALAAVRAGDPAPVAHDIGVRLNARLLHTWLSERAPGSSPPP